MSGMKPGTILTAFSGGRETTGPFDGLQAEMARIPLAHATCVKLPDEVGDDTPC
jgi:threonine dehydrogenase-like Zn-dependent dehydrogenase